MYNVLHIILWCSTQVFTYSLLMRVTKLTTTVQGPLACLSPPTCTCIYVCRRHVHIHVHMHVCRNPCAFYVIVYMYTCRFPCTHVHVAFRFNGRQLTWASSGFVGDKCSIQGIDNTRENKFWTVSPCACTYGTCTYSVSCVTLLCSGTTWALCHM